MHTSRFRVQLYDVDAYGQLRPMGMLRFLQQAASDASAAVGFDIDWYERQHAVWVIRRSTVDFLAPAFYRDELAVRTWVSNVRRVRSQRQYKVVRAIGGETLARGGSDWVYVDLQRGGPARPPDELQRALMPEGVQRGERAFAHWPTPPAGAFRVERRVESADLDSAAHVNNALYAVYVEQALFDALTAHGWRFEEAAREAPFRVAAHDLEYREATRYGDRLQLIVWVRALDRDGFTAACQIERDGRRVLCAETRYVYGRTDGRGKLEEAVAASSSIAE